MSNQPSKRFGLRIFLFSALLIFSALTPPLINAEETEPGSMQPHPLLVRARPGDTPATLAQRHLNDAAKGWMIREYNLRETFSGGEAVVVPTAAFRPGGLAPDGYQTVPVLSYTDIGGTPGQKHRLSRDAFNAQMQWLSNQGFNSLTPAQLIDFMAFSGQLPQRSVLITADTESAAFYNLAVPVLTALGFRATIFVAVDRVGKKGAMTWDQLRQLNHAGFTIGCRGRYGRSLIRRKKGQSFEANFRWIESELQYAKKMIETHLGEPCRFLAYPQGSTNSLLAAMAAKLGFSAAFDLSPGSTPFFADRFGIHRNRIDSRITLNRFSTLLTTTIAADLN